MGRRSSLRRGSCRLCQRWEGLHLPYGLCERCLPRAVAFLELHGQLTLPWEVQ